MYTIHMCYCQLRCSLRLPKRLRHTETATYLQYIEGRKNACNTARLEVFVIQGSGLSLSTMPSGLQSLLTSPCSVVFRGCEPILAGGGSPGSGPRCVSRSVGRCQHRQGACISILGCHPGADGQSVRCVRPALDNAPGHLGGSQ